jgi:hypothetical protein
MRHESRTSWSGWSVVSVAFALLSLSVVSVAGQVEKSPSRVTSTVSGTSTVPRAPDGHPDLQGVWSFATLTPLERPSAFAGKETLTSNEAEEFAKQRLVSSNKDRRDGGGAADVERAYNEFWWDFGTKATTQPSLVVDPPSGRIPALTAEAQQRQSQRQNLFDNPEDRPISERCILGFNSGPPMVPSAYNNNVQIVQTADHVVILNEMIHSARIVPLSGRPHPTKDMRYLTGDSVGHWEGDTLIVDTTNFSKNGGFRGASANLHLIERISRVDQGTLRYEFTIDDPATWTKRWTVSIPMSSTNELIYEYACHEGNYALEGVLRGARHQEEARQQSHK